jgi:hypothetical protein
VEAHKSSAALCAYSAPEPHPLTNTPPIAARSVEGWFGNVDNMFYVVRNGSATMAEKPLC